MQLQGQQQQPQRAASERGSSRGSRGSRARAAARLSDLISSLKTTQIKTIGNAVKLIPIWTTSSRRRRCQCLSQILIIHPWYDLVGLCADWSNKGNFHGKRVSLAFCVCYFKNYLTACNFCGIEAMWKQLDRTNIPGFHLYLVMRWSICAFQFIQNSPVSNRCEFNAACFSGPRGATCMPNRQLDVNINPRNGLMLTTTTCLSNVNNEV